MILVRFILISLIVFLIIRSFLRLGNVGRQSTEGPEPEKNSRIPEKKVSKKIGEYIDYEELKRKDR